MRTSFDDMTMAGRRLTGLPSAVNPSDAVPKSDFGVAFQSGGFKSGCYSLLGQSIGTSNALGNGALRMFAFAVGKTISVTRIGSEITIVGDAGCVLRLGIYADDGSGMPSALIAGSEGTIPGDAVAVAEATISCTLTPGIYWTGGAIQGVTTTQPTVRTVTAPLMPIQVAATTIPAAGQTVTGCNVGSVTGALPGSVAPTALNSGNAPRVFLKVA